MPRHTPGEDKDEPSQPPKLGPILGRHKALLSDPKVRSWYEARSLRSRLSADQYLRQFGFLLERIELDPTKVVSLARKDPDRLRDLLVRDAAKLKRAGRLDSYISKFHEGLRSYFRFHRVTFDGFPSLSPIKGASLVRERVPTPEELNRVLDRLSLRSRVCALFMAHAGLRPGVLGAYQAEGGLTLGDLPDLRLNEKPNFTEEPFAIRVPAHLSKTRVSYYTFGSSQLSSALLSYLGDRVESGERLTPATPVISVRSTRGVAARRRGDKRFASGFVVTAAVVREIHQALTAAAPEGVRWRPYVLRAYCSSRLLMAEGAGKLIRDLREAILGHDLGNSGRYTLGKTWGDDMLREARAQYKRAEPYLLTSGIPTESPAERLVRALIRAKGVTETEIDEAASMNPEELDAWVKKRGLLGAPEKRRQRPVSVAQAHELVEAGWEYVGPLGDEVILREPEGPTPVHQQTHPSGQPFSGHA